MFTDTHCHLYKEYYKNIDEVIKRAENNNVNKYIVNGCDMKSNMEVLELINKYDNIYGAIGFQPQELEDFQESYFEWLEKNIKSKKIVAIGEIGLDYFYDDSDKEKQLAVFKHQLEIANKYDIPVIIHCRNAIQDTYNLLKEIKVKGSLHCYSGSKEMAKEFIKLGMYIGVGGIITFKNAKNIVDVVNSTDINHIILETDSPYLSPEPYRGKPNEPAHIKEIATKIAEVKSLKLQDVSSVTEANVRALFDI